MFLFATSVTVCSIDAAFAAGPHSGLNVKVINTPLPVTGAVSTNPVETVQLLELDGIPMNFRTDQPLDTSSCDALRVVLKSPQGGNSLAFSMLDANIDAAYFGTVVGSGKEASEVISLPPPLTSIVMGVSGDCPDCALAIYCR